MQPTFPWVRARKRGDRRPSLRWLLLPPVIALALFLGPFQSSATPPEPAKRTAADDVAAQPAGPAKPAVGDQIPAMPGTLQVASALLGVLLLGGVGLVLLRRMQRNTQPAGGYLAVRQTLRLGRHQLHAIEFDQQILLVGECDGALAVLSTAADPHVADDEQIVDQRAADGDEAGATPRDLVLPRPPRARREQPKPARPTNAALRDFKALLRRARVESAT